MMHVSKSILHAVLVLLVLALVSCSKEAAETPATTSTAQQQAVDEDPHTGRYNPGMIGDGGAITGRVVLQGEIPELPGFEITANKNVCNTASDNNRLHVADDGGMQYAVVWLEGVKTGKAYPEIPHRSIVIDQEGCQYNPHVVAAPLGTIVLFQNSDNIAHNVRVEDSKEDIMLNVTQAKKGAQDEFTITSVGPLSIGCDYHPWMNAYLFGTDSPYYAVTAKDGSYTIDDIPPGTYTVKVWFNGLKPIPKKDTRGNIIRYTFSDPYSLEKQITVEPGGTADATFTIAPKL